MNLKEFNEAYREMLNAGNFYILGGKQIRLCRNTDFEYCPITAVARFKLDKPFFLNNFRDAGDSLQLSEDTISFIVDIADRSNDPSFHSYLCTTAGESLFSFTYDPNEFPD